MNETSLAQNGKTEVDEGGADADGVEEVEVSEVLLTTSGTGNPTPMNTAEKDAGAIMTEGMVEVECLTVVLDSKEEGGDAGDADRHKYTGKDKCKDTDMDRASRVRATTMVTDDPLLIMVLTRSLHPRRRRTPLTRPHLRL